ncbi:MAG: type II toxin-antitoxin system VapC family toxin [Verrucomicrobia bacterium]|nr:type II toxin-antitoxin system VapC family toxin [Verrucomicrobiota bacterium]
MNCLLDTCTLLWLADDPDQMPQSVRRVLSEPGSVIHVSPVSAWELGIKVAKGKLQLPNPVSEWFPEVCRWNGLVELPLDSRLAARSTELSPIHKDPFDRILIATAMEHALTLVTPDDRIRQYPNLKSLW